MKFAMSALSVVVLLFAVSQARALPAAQLDIIPTSSLTGAESDSNCLEMYTQLLTDLASEKQTASNNMSDCVSQGNSHEVCDEKFGPTIREINSRITAENQKLQMCLKQSILQMIKI